MPSLVFQSSRAIQHGIFSAEMHDPELKCARLIISLSFGDQALEKLGKRLNVMI